MHRKEIVNLTIALTQLAIGVVAIAKLKQAERNHHQPAPSTGLSGEAVAFYRETFSSGVALGRELERLDNEDPSSDKAD